MKVFSGRYSGQNIPERCWSGCAQRTFSQGQRRPTPFTTNTVLMGRSRGRPRSVRGCPAHGGWVYPKLLRSSCDKIDLTAGHARSRVGLPVTLARDQGCRSRWLAGLTVDRVAEVVLPTRRVPHFGRGGPGPEVASVALIGEVARWLCEMRWADSALRTLLAEPLGLWDASQRGKRASQVCTLPPDIAHISASFVAPSNPQIVRFTRLFGASHQLLSSRRAMAAP